MEESTIIDIDIEHDIEPANDNDLINDLFYENFKVLEDILNQLACQHQRRSHQNVLSKLKERNFDEKNAADLINSAIDRKLIYSYIYSKQLNYKFTTSQTPNVVIRDAVEDAATSTESIPPSVLPDSLVIPESIPLVTSTESTPPSASLDSLVMSESIPPSVTPKSTITSVAPESIKPACAPEFITVSEFSEFKRELLADMTSIKSAIDQQQNIMWEKPLDEKSENQHSLVGSLLNHITYLQQTLTTIINSQSSIFANLATNIKPTPTLNPQNTPIAQNKPTSRDASAEITPKIPPNPAFISKSKSPAHTPLILGEENAPNANVPAKSSTLPSSNNKPRNETAPKQTFSRKQVLIVGDSMLNCLDEKDMRRDAFVRVRNHPGASTTDLIHHARAHSRTKHDAVIIMGGTNDISTNNLDENKGKQKMDSCANMKNLISELKHSLPDAHIAICQVTSRKDRPGIMKDVQELNQQFKLLAQREQIGYVNTSHFRPHHTGKKGIHPNEDGVDILEETLLKYISKVSRT